MKMSLTLSDFCMEHFDFFKEQVNRFAPCTVQVGGEDTVFLTCTADMVHCMEVLAVSDLYWGGEKR